MTKTNSLLIIVHPGSACGSAEMNLGYANASEQRGYLQMAIEGWEGPIAVIDSDLSDELKGFRGEWRLLGNAIDNALDGARSRGHAALRIRGDDSEKFNQEDAALEIAAQLELSPDCDIALTGAWYHSSDGGGCVGSVKQVLENRGYTSRLLDPVDLDYDNGADEDDELDEVPPPRGMRGP